MQADVIKMPRMAKIGLTYFTSYLIFGLMGYFFQSGALAAGFTIREISMLAPNQIQIQVDGAIPRSAISVDYVRDNVQFSFQGTSIYPAKMMHVEDSSFQKIFAYQYSPNLVRIRFTVPGNAESFKNQLQWNQTSGNIVINFTRAQAPVAASKVTPAHTLALTVEKEKNLLSKVMGGDSKVVSKSETKLDFKKESKVDAIVASKPAGPSLKRALFSMLAVVGGLGLVLFFVKRRKSGIQATKVGNPWWNFRKPKSFIEIMGQHQLGPKQSIVVVKIRGQQFVLGVTHDHVQLITQIDVDENEIDVLDDPAVTASIGKMLGANQKINQLESSQLPSHALKQDAGFSFDSMLRGSDGAQAIQAKTSPRAAVSSTYASAASAASTTVSSTSVRAEIRRRLEGMRYQ